MEGAYKLMGASLKEPKMRLQIEVSDESEAKILEMMASLYRMASMTGEELTTLKNNIFDLIDSDPKVKDCGDLWNEAVFLIVLSMDTFPLYLKSSFLSVITEISSFCTLRPELFDLIQTIQMIFHYLDPSVETDDIVNVLSFIFNSHPASLLAIQRHGLLKTLLGIHKVHTNTEILMYLIEIVGLVFQDPDLDARLVIDHIREFFEKTFSSDERLQISTFHLISSASFTAPDIISTDVLSESIMDHMLEAFKSENSKMSSAALESLVSIFAEGSPNVHAVLIEKGLLDIVEDLFKRDGEDAQNLVDLVVNVVLCGKEYAGLVVSRHLSDQIINKLASPQDITLKRSIAALISALVRKGMSQYLDLLLENQELRDQLAEMLFLGDFDLSMNLFDLFSLLIRHSVALGTSQSLLESFSALGINCEVFEKYSENIEEGSANFEDIFNELTEPPQ